MKTQYKTIPAYNRAQKGEDKAICALLMREIERVLPKAESKIWHGSPVWFLDENPIVAYSKQKKGICLMFFSGQSFKTPGLAPEGSFKAAEIFYVAASDAKVAPLRKWLGESKKIQWDYKNIVKRRGRLVRL